MANREPTVLDRRSDLFCRFSDHPPPLFPLLQEHDHESRQFGLFHDRRPDEQGILAQPFHPDDRLSALSQGRLPALFYKLRRGHNPTRDHPNFAPFFHPGHGPGFPATPLPAHRHFPWPRGPRRDFVAGALRFVVHDRQSLHERDCHDPRIAGSGSRGTEKIPFRLGIPLRGHHGPDQARRSFSSSHPGSGCRLHDTE